MNFCLFCSVLPGHLENFPISTLFLNCCAIFCTRIQQYQALYFFLPSMRLVAMLLPLLQSSELCYHWGVLQTTAAKKKKPQENKTCLMDCVVRFSACPSTTVATQISCAAGWYAESNATSCTQCPAGFECPDVNAATVYVSLCACLVCCQCLQNGG